MNTRLPTYNALSKRYGKIPSWWDRLRARNKPEFDLNLAALLKAQADEILDSLHEAKQQEHREEVQKQKADAEARLKDRFRSR